MSKPPKSSAARSGNIYIGMGGWTFEPWRGGASSGGAAAQVERFDIAFNAKDEVAPCHA